jgi:ribosomal protein S27E
MPTIQEDTFYYVEKIEGVCFEKSKIRAMCVECANKLRKQMSLMYWPGKSKGYNEAYDSLECSICNKTIYKRENNVTTENS